MGQSPHQGDLVFRESGSHGRDDIVKPVLVGHHGVHVAFDDDRAVLPYRLFGQVHGVQDPGLVEHRCARGIEVFRGGVVVQGPAAESGNACRPVPDGDHQPPAEQVVVASVVRCAGQTGIGQVFCGVTGIGQVLEQAIVPSRAVAELEGLQRPFVDTPSKKVFAHEGRFGLRQGALEKLACSVIDLEQ